MKIIYNDIIPVKGFEALNLCGILFVRKNVIVTDVIINHERVHTQQMKELFYVLFYLIYILEWFFKLFKYRSKAYYNVSFEREAYANDENLDYLDTRKKYAFTKYS